MPRFFQRRRSALYLVSLALVCICLVAWLVTANSSARTGLGKHAPAVNHSADAMRQVVSGGNLKRAVKSNPVGPVGRTNTATISGTISNSQGATIEGATVTATNADTNNIEGTSVSNSSGQYGMTVPLGTYHLQVAPPPGSTYVPTTLNNISVTADITQDITLTTAALVQISGQVLTFDNNPAPNVGVIVSGTNISSITDTNGNYQFQIAPGTYSLQLGGASYLPHPFFMNVDQPATFSQNTVLNFNLPQPVALSGIVSDSNGQPVSGAKITLGTQFSGLSGYSGTSAKAGFSTANGAYQILVFPGTVPSGAVQVESPSGSGLSNATVPLSQILVDTSLNITLQRNLVTVSGRVLTFDNNPAPNVGVTLLNTNITSFADSNSNYQFQVAPGTYTIQLGGASYAPHPFVMTVDQQATFTQNTTLDFNLPQPVTLSGVVTDSGGQAVLGARISLGTSFTNLNGYSGTSAKAVTSDANGAYQVLVFPGTVSSGIVTVTAPQGSGLSGTTVPLTQILSNTTVNMTLQRNLVTVSGRVLTFDNSPAPGVGVTALEVNVSSFADSNGNYQFQVAPGTYTIQLGGASYLPHPFVMSTSVTFTQNTVRDFILPQPVALSGVVSDSNGQPVAGAKITLGTQFTNLNGYAGTSSKASFSAANGAYQVLVFPGAVLNGGVRVDPPAGSNLSGLTIPLAQFTTDQMLNITLQRPVHTITGQILDSTNSPLTGVTVTLSGSQSARSTTDGNGNYQFVNLSDGGAYTVTPSRTSYLFNPQSAAFSNLTGNQAANFSGSLMTYNVSGHIADSGGTALSDVVVTLSGPTTAVTQTDASGNYTFTGVAAFANYSVEAAKPGVAFVPGRHDLPNLSSDVTASFTAIPNAPPIPFLGDNFNTAQRDPDKFNFGSLSTNSTAFEPLIGVAQQNGHLTITPVADFFGTHYNGYTTLGTVNLLKSNIRVELIQSALGGAQTILSLGTDQANNYSFIVQSVGGSTPARSVGDEQPASLNSLTSAMLIFQTRINGQVSTESIPYDPVQHRFWLFRYASASNSILFETSPDNATWTARRSVVVQQPLTPMVAELSAGTSGPVTNPGAAVFDNFRLASNLALTADFTGDLKADLSVFRPAEGNWYLLDSTGGALRVQQWGTSGDKLVPGDYDGDGINDLAVFRPANSNWYIIQSSTNTIKIVNWGNSNDLPAPRDFDGDGQTDVAVFRSNEGNWYIRLSATNTTRVQGWGQSTDKLVPGDYDGDGLADIAVWRPSEGNWYIIKSTGGVSQQQWGLSTDIPVPGDYDGDGQIDLAVFRPAEGNWYIKKSGGGTIVKNWGNSSDVPIPADYNGDGLADIAVFRPAEGNWYVINSADGLPSVKYLGVGGDIPVPSTYFP